MTSSVFTATILGRAEAPIVDFKRNVNWIDLSRSGLDSLAQLTFKVLNSGLIAYGDYDGDGLDVGDLILQLTGIFSLDASASSSRDHLRRPAPAPEGAAYGLLLFS